MHPILFNFGPLTISSFGFFLALGFLSAVFMVWRLGRLYDISEEKILDLSILAFFGGLLGARIYFVAFNWRIFESLDKVVLINRYPGLSFWGGIIGGFLTLWFFSRRTKIPFWQIADFAAVGFLLGAALGNIGCLLGGCNFGVMSNLPWAVFQVGAVGKRLPLSLFESLIFFFLFFKLYKAVVKFHFAGKIVSLSFISVGIVKFLSGFWRMDALIGRLLPLSLAVLGLVIFYRCSKRDIKADLVALAFILTNSKKRQMALVQFQKNWYNFMISWKIRFSKMGKFANKLPAILKRRFNVRATPKDIIEN